MAWKSKRKVMHAYNVTAQMYGERYSEEQNKKYKEALEYIDVTNSIILDVGCGSGLLFNIVAPVAKIVVGVDISLMLLKEAKKQAKLFENIFILQADADHLPFRQNFNMVSAFTILQNMPKPTLTLQELRRVTKPGGKVVVTALKKAFRLEEFMNLLEDNGKGISAFVNKDEINCYIAVLTT